MNEAVSQKGRGQFGLRHYRGYGRLRFAITALQFGNWPWFDFAIRLFLAHAFWRSGWLKLSNWDTALYLATYEYPVSWLEPSTAVFIGVAIEIIAPIFLVLGFMTRVAAFPMLLLTLVVHLEYVSLPVNIFQMSFFLWFCIAGSGPFSLDNLFRRGLASSAFPGSHLVTRLLSLCKNWLSHFWLLCGRLWLAWIFIAAMREPKTANAMNSALQAMNDMLMGSFIHQIAPVVFLLCLLVALGLFTRLSFLVLLLMEIVLSFSNVDRSYSLIEQFYPLLLLGIFIFLGAGRFSLDHMMTLRLDDWRKRIEETVRKTASGLPHIVIIGAGFGGLAAARALNGSLCQITLIDRHNYHLFQPLLYQVATASLSPADIAAPIREIMRNQDNARVLLDEVTGIDRTRKLVIGRETQTPYDYLIVATGAHHSYFGKDSWEPYAPGLKRIEDATEIRRRLLLAFERAETAADEETRSAWLTFAIVGGGPTGVEIAGAIAELARYGLTREFRNIDPSLARIILVQGASRVLPTFNEKLSEKAQKSLESLRVEVRTKSIASGIDDKGIRIGEEFIASRTVFWAAGVVASPAGDWLKAETDRAGRVVVDGHLSLLGDSSIFVIGDTASSLAWAGNPVPGLAPAAKQQGGYVAKLIRARLAGRGLQFPEFSYHHKGSLATIGRRAAVADFGRLKLSGSLAWWLWGVVHVLFLSNARSRAAVAIEWLWAYATYRRSTRLITGGKTRS